MDGISILSILIAFISMITAFQSIHISNLVRQDTTELTKFSPKPVYYAIHLYLTNETGNSSHVYDKYLNLNLKLVIDDFEIKNNETLNVNYNAIFTKIKYFMVYDYSLKTHEYKYIFHSLDDKVQAQLTYSELYSASTQMNYSFTPNKKYCYILIYTETMAENNLDLVFFSYHDEGDSFWLDTINENGQEKIEINRIDYDTFLCKEYFINLWASNDGKQKEDLEFIFNVYEDLRSKKI